MRIQALPTEVIMEVVTCLLDYDLSVGKTISKPPWTVVESFSLASRKFRAIALQAWFCILHVKTSSDWADITSDWPQIHRWARAIHCTQDTCDFSKADIAPFARLRHMRLDIAGPQSPLFGTDVERVIDNIPPAVRALEVRGLTWPEPTVIRRIARAVPELRVLSLRQPMIWCGLCNTCSISELKEPFPGTLVYDKGLGLPLHYARYLHTVKLTVAVGDGAVALDKDNSNIWAGECEMCMERMYEDDSFRRQWVERKRKPEADHRPPALKRVEWRLLECTGEHWSEFIDAWPSV